MIPCKTAFIDARTPGSDKKENFCLIGQGVAENPEQIIHINKAHGFNVGAARQPHGCKNSHHSHDTEEVFMIHSGEWMFTWGENGEDGSIILSKGDTISLPSNMFRGFENVGEDDALMFSILGLDESGSAGNVLWAPYVFDEAKKHGLVLLEDGRLIDTAAGKEIPNDGREQLATTSAQVDELDKLTIQDIKNCVASQDELSKLATGGLSNLDGVSEIAIIGPENTHENLGPGKMPWLHGFHMRRIIIEPQSNIPKHLRMEEEVIIVQSGNIDLICDGHELTLGAGDLFTSPINSTREYINTNDQVADLIVIRRGNQPAPAEFI